ncbi:DNA topoisomerase subunit B [Occallatibacter riparius]|uniref:DNA topoisomerase (ATP-hydrolyzing) n=1 Tax=Occallatibacter riparius TaxID=1002689 RepID=A0A9J7BSG1_9BACT|nr:hypothetical protein [Occallatibacter riparius]UWZ83973.1 hypothetical protein MOP44_25865 [Occallatibacter riparius]
MDGVALHLEEQAQIAAVRVEVVLHSDGSVTVFNDGRGLPVDRDGIEPHKSRAEKILTSLYAPAMNGLAIANALSQQLNLKIFRDGNVWQQEYRAGNPTNELMRAGTSSRHGTQIHFLLDPGIFSTTEFDFDSLSRDLRTLASKHANLTIKLTDERTTD